MPTTPDELEPGQCPETHPLIDNGAHCRYMEGHLSADLPHTTKNGFWWFP